MLKIQVKNEKFYTFKEYIKSLIMNKTASFDPAFFQYFEQNSTRQAYSGLHDYSFLCLFGTLEKHQVVQKVFRPREALLSYFAIN